MEDTAAAAAVLNINVGVLGHVDSGKTSLVKALSTSLSTAALDKNPQSQERGITLDLGFSSFTLDLPDHLKPVSGETTAPYSKLQFTLVDCPGHASLIRTIIGGAQIIDMMILVIDINRGIQTQTAECVVIGEITTNKLLIVLNKVDMILPEQRAEKIEKVQRRLRKIFSTTKFHDAPMLCVSAAIGGERVASIGSSGSTAAAPGDRKGGGKLKGVVSKPPVQSEGITDVISTLTSMVDKIPKRNVDAPFYFAVDHCFAIRGHGTVLTGTVLSGSVAIHQTIEIPDLHEQKKVKSMQMFRKPVKLAIQGDRVGICVTGLDPSIIERGILAAPGSVPVLSSAICMVKKVRYFKQHCRSKQRFHISVGHTTVVAIVTFFGAIELEKHLQEQRSRSRSLDATNKKGEPESLPSLQLDRNAFPVLKFNWDQDFEYQDAIYSAADDVKLKISSNAKARVKDDDALSNACADSGDIPPSDVNYGAELGPHLLKHGEEAIQYVLLQFQHPILAPLNSLVIGSRLETDARETAVSSTHCRIAFFGPVLCGAAPSEAFLPTSTSTAGKPRIYNWKVKEAEIHRLMEVKKETGLCTEAIGWKLFSKEAGISRFLGMKLETIEGDVVGYIHSSFGSTGKFKIKFPLGIHGLRSGAKLYLRFKRFIYDRSKTMVQEPCDYTPISERSTKASAAYADVVEESYLLLDPTEEKDDDMALPPEVIAGFAIDSDEEDIPYIENVMPADSGIVTVGMNKPSSETAQSLSSLSAGLAIEDMTNSAPLDIASSEKDSKVDMDNGARSNEEVNVRVGTVESMKADPSSAGGCICIVSGAFRMEENIKEHIGAVAHGPASLTGTLTGPYAKMGKCKISFETSDDLCVGALIRIILKA